MIHAVNLIASFVNAKGKSNDGFVKAAVVRGGEREGPLVLRLEGGREVTVQLADKDAQAGLKPGQNVLVNLADGKIVITDAAQAGQTAQTAQGRQSLQSAAQLLPAAQSGQPLLTQQSAQPGQPSQAQPLADKDTFVSGKHAEPPQSGVKETVSQSNIKVVDFTVSQEKILPDGIYKINSPELMLDKAALEELSKGNYAAVRLATVNDRQVVTLITNDGLQAAITELRSTLESPLLRSLPIEVLMKILNEHGGINTDTLAALDKLLQNRGFSINPASQTMVDRIDQWLRLALDNPRLAVDLAERVPISGAKETAEQIETLVRISAGTLPKEMSAGISPERFFVTQEKIVGDNKTVGNTTVSDKSVDNKITGNMIVNDKGVDSKIVSNNIAGDKGTDNKIANDKAVDNKIVSNNITGDKGIDNKVANDKTVDNKIVGNNIAGDKGIDNKVASDKTVDNKIINDKSIDNKIAGNNIATDKIESFCRAAFSAAPSALLDLLKHVDSLNTINTAQLPPDEARRIVSDVVNRLPAAQAAEGGQVHNPVSTVKPEILHDPRLLSAQNPNAETAPAQNQQQAQTSVIPSIRAEYSALTETAIQALLGGSDGKTAAVAINENIDALRGFIERIQVGEKNAIADKPAIPVDEIKQNSLNIVNSLKTAVDSLLGKTDEAAAPNKQQPAPHTTSETATKGEIDMGQKIKLLDLVRSAISSLDNALRPMAREERPVPPNFYDRVVSAPERQISADTKNSVFTQITTAQRLIRQAVETINTKAESVAGKSVSVKPETTDGKNVNTKPEIADGKNVNIKPESVNGKNVNANIKPEPAETKISNVNTKPESVDGKSVTTETKAGDFLQMAQRLWANTEKIRAGFQEAFSSLDLQSRVSPLGPSDGSTAQVIRQSVDALRTEILLDVSKALREIFSSIEELRSTAGQLSESLRALPETEKALTESARSLEQQARQSGGEVMDRMKDILKELSRLQITALQAREQAADGTAARSATPADVIRSTAMSAARGLESLQLLSAQTRGGEVQQQVIALPVKMGREWTEVQVKFVKDRKRGTEKESGGSGRTSIYLNVSPSALGQVSAQLDFHPPASLKLSFQFEKPEVTKWFKNEAAALRETLAQAGLPGAALEFHNKRPVSKKIETVEQQQVSIDDGIKDGKVDLKI
jgi:hypothetical protein